MTITENRWWKQISTMPKETRFCKVCGKESTPRWPSKFRKPREEYICFECVHQDLTYRENLKKANRERSKNPVWIENHRKMVEKNLSNPDWLENRKNAQRESLKDPISIESHKRGMEKRSKNVKWLESIRTWAIERSNDIEWVGNHKRGIEKRSKNTKWLDSMKILGKKRGEDTGCVERHLIGITGQGFWYGHPTLISYNDGKSRLKYCEIFQKVKSRVRIFFNNICTKCGKVETPNTDTFHVHHVFYEKKTCCWIDDNGEYWTNLNARDHKEKDYYIGENPNYFAPLCDSCHGSSNGKFENRKKNADMLRKLIDEKYNGKSYYTEEEMLEMGYRKYPKSVWKKI